MAFQGFLTSFMSPASSLISAGQSIQEMTTQMERVEDVMSYPSDPIFEPKEKKAEFQKLTGEIEMKDVSFGYSKFDPPLIRNFSMHVKPGQKIAYLKYLNGLYNTLVNTFLSAGITSVFSLIYLTQIFKYAKSLVVPALTVTVLTVLIGLVASIMQISIVSDE